MSTQAQISWKQRISKWTTPKGLASIIVFLIIVFLLEYLIVYSSISFGLEDNNMLSWQVLSLTITISPLFHILPLSVMLVLVLSWMHLTKHVAFPPCKLEPIKPRPLPPKKIEKLRFKTLRRQYKKISKKIGDIGRRIKEAFLENRLADLLRRAVIKSAWTIILSFAALIVLIYLIVYPQLIPAAANWLLGGGSSAFQDFVIGTINAANAIGQALSPIGWIAANIINGLAASAPGFRNAVIGFTTPFVKPLVDLNLVGKYVLVQNVAAWTAALTALYYGQIAHRPVRRSK
ncbi:MAG: hypothetical protein ACQXXH_04990 [Candidatus Bathyarchaeia archaeon]|nr:hypothetical protein [Candidatus Bathyarchaeota archaeon A05DMB-4]MDH7595090.1 hypothetical protein [Candidatus Bathyarchaeota archaeon]